jgi:hypothetical protein
MNWTTKDSRIIPIEKLTTSHLLNCIRLTERRLEAVERDRER